MRPLFLPVDRSPDEPDLLGFDRPLARIAAEQRESLCRGVAFILFLAVSCLLIVYVPLIVGEPDWASAGVLSMHQASRIPFEARVRVVSPSQ